MGVADAIDQKQPDNPQPSDDPDAAHTSEDRSVLEF